MFSPKDFVPDSLKSRVVYQFRCAAVELVILVYYINTSVLLGFLQLRKSKYFHMKDYDNFTCEDIDDFSDINFVSLIVLKFVGVSSKHLRIFLESLRESSEIFGHLREFSEIHGNVRERSSGLRNYFGKSSEIFGKSSKSRHQ